ncbi:MAG: hypothetical protein VKL42_22815 [Snowella sp.]|nr:hypothetical protein [Snowella sp.]
MSNNNSNKERLVYWEKIVNSDQSWDLGMPEVLEPGFFRVGSGEICYSNRTEDTLYLFESECDIALIDLQLITLWIPDANSIYAPAYSDAVQKISEFIEDLCRNIEHEHFSRFNPFISRIIDLKTLYYRIGKLMKILDMWLETIEKTDQSEGFYEENFPNFKKIYQSKIFNKNWVTDHRIITIK